MERVLWKELLVGLVLLLGIGIGGASAKSALAAEKVVTQPVEQEETDLTEAKQEEAEQEKADLTESKREEAEQEKAEQEEAEAEAKYDCDCYVIHSGEYVITSDSKGITVQNLLEQSKKVLVQEDDFEGGSLAFDGEFLYYTNGKPGTNGICQIRPDGTEHRVFLETEGRVQLLEMTEEYLYFIEFEEMENNFQLCIYDYHAGKLVNTLPYVNNIVLKNGKMYYHELRFDVSPVKFYVADTDGTHRKVITKRYMDSYFCEDGTILYFDHTKKERYQLKLCDSNGKNKVRIGKKLDADLILYMNEDYVYYLTWKESDDKTSTINQLYAYSINDGKISCLNTSEGLFEIVSSEEGTLYLRNTKTGLIFLVDGIRLTPTRTKVSSFVYRIFQERIYYYKYKKNGDMVVKSVALKKM